MSTKFEEVKDSLEKLLLFLNEPSNTDLRKSISITLKDKRPNILQLSTASDKYVFLSDPGKFNLNEEEALGIWRYFKKNPMNYRNDETKGPVDYEPYEFFLEMKKAFPKLLSEEDSKYIELINEKRLLLGFNPIDF